VEKNEHGRGGKERGSLPSGFISSISMARPNSKESGFVQGHFEVLQGEKGQLPLKGTSRPGAHRGLNFQKEDHGVGLFNQGEETISLEGVTLNRAGKVPSLEWVGVGWGRGGPGLVR